MAGTNPSFDAALFRQAIRDTMIMGLPNATQEKPTFRWSPEKTFTTADPAGAPYDFTASPVTTVAPADVQVPVAVEFSARPANSIETGMGEFDASRVIITALDEDYALIQGADQVILGGNTYDVQFVGPPIGLFEVTVYQIFAIARDES